MLRSATACLGLWTFQRFGGSLQHELSQAAWVEKGLARPSRQVRWSKILGTPQGRIKCVSQVSGKLRFGVCLH